MSLLSFALRSSSDQSRTLHYGFAQSIIDMPAPMIKAWIADAHSLRGYREIEGGDIESVTKYRLDQFNDHSYVDYRRSAGFWPILDREAVLYHISKDMEDGSFIHASFSCKHDQAPVDGSDSVRVQFSGVHKVRQLEDGRSEMSYCFSVCDMGSIPQWLLQKRVRSTLGVVGRCKMQLDKKALRAKMSTWKERMRLLRLRMGLKWTVEGLVEKTLMVVSFPACAYLFGSKHEPKMLALVAILLVLTETFSDVVTTVVAKRSLDIDIGGERRWSDAGFDDLRSLRNCVLSTVTPAICCVLVFLILGL